MVKIKRNFTVTLGSFVHYNPQSTATIQHQGPSPDVEQDPRSESPVVGLHCVLGWREPDYLEETHPDMQIHTGRPLWCRNTIFLAVQQEGKPPSYHSTLYMQK